jgi:hypothetical protein
MAEIKSATIIEDEPGYMMTPEMPGCSPVKVRINTTGPAHFWQFGGKVPVLEVINEDEIAKRYFKVPFFFFNPKTGNLSLIDPSLAQVAHLIVKEWVRSRNWAKVVGYEEI